MLTQAMPALAQALNGFLPDAAVRQLMQTLGNCQQPLAHRGAVQIGNELRTSPNGTARPGAWNPSDYSHLIPDAGGRGFVDVPRAGSNSYYNNYNNTVNNNRNNFEFPLNSTFNTNQYYGGDTLTVFGDTRLGDLITNNATITNLNVTTINNNPPGQPPPPPPPPGTPGGVGPGGGGPGGGGPGGGALPFDPSVLFPARIDKKAIVTNVRARPAQFSYDRVEKISYPDGDIPLTQLAHKATSVNVNSGGTLTLDMPYKGKLTGVSGEVDSTIQVPSSFNPADVGGTFSGDVAIPLGGPVSGTEARCTGTVQVPTAGSITSLIATCTPKYKVPTTGSLDKLTVTLSSKYKVPTKGKLSAGDLNAKTSVDIGIPTAGKVTTVSLTSDPITLPEYTATLPNYQGTVVSFSALTSAALNSGAGVDVDIYVPVIDTTKTYLKDDCTLAVGYTNQKVTIKVPSYTLSTTSSTLAPTVTSTPVGGATLTSTRKAGTTCTATVPCKDAAVAITPAASKTKFEGTVTLNADIDVPLDSMTEAERSTTDNSLTVNSATISLGGSQEQTTYDGSVNVTNSTVTLNAPEARSIDNGSVIFDKYGSVTLDPKNAATQTISGNVSYAAGSSVKLATAPQSVKLTVAIPDATITLTETKPEIKDLAVTGTVEYEKFTGAVVNAKADLTPTTEIKSKEVQVELDPLLNVSRDFLIYYRPRF